VSGSGTGQTMAAFGPVGFRLLRGHKRTLTGLASRKMDANFWRHRPSATCCHQQTSLSPSTLQILSSGEGRIPPHGSHSSNPWDLRAPVGAGEFLPCLAAYPFL
jgi:hypothetical protein